MTDRPVFTRECARRIDEAARRIHNHREHVREEQQLPEYRRDNIPESALERVVLATQHDVTVLLHAENDELEVKVRIGTLDPARRHDNLSDISLFFSSVVDAIQRGVERHVSGAAGEIEPELSFQGRDTDAYYRCSQQIRGL